MTRAELAKKTGIPEPTLKDIELGKFKLSYEVAMKIAFGCGVHPKSLRNNEAPLLDLMGKPFTANSGAQYEEIAHDESRLEARRELYQAVVEAALEKRIGRLMEYCFDQWVEETCKTFGLQTLLTEKLTQRLESFDPKWIPWNFRPRNRELAAEWKAYEEEISQEQFRLYESGWLLELFPTDPSYTESELQELEKYRLYRCRSEAQSRVARQREKARWEAEEAQRDDRNGRKAKPGMRPRSVTRKAA
jgi:transcriptional regulator with XRE-family HTH domain